MLVSDRIDEFMDYESEKLDWLDQHRYMWQQCSPEEGRTRLIVALIEQEPTFMK